MAPAPREPFLTGKLLEAQGGVLTTEQLLGLGLSHSAICKRTQRQELYRIYRGVYSISPPSLLPLKGRRLAAVLACGPTAALSHRSAARLHGLRPNHRDKIDVILPGSHPPQHDGIDGHCSATLAGHDVTTVDGIPVTTVARTALDLAAVVNRRSVERALDQAEVLRTYDGKALTDQIDRNPRHPGTHTLKEILDGHIAGTTVTWSELEELPPGQPRGGAPRARAQRVRRPRRRRTRAPGRLRVAGAAGRRRGGRPSVPRHARGVRGRPSP